MTTPTRSHRVGTEMSPSLCEQALQLADLPRKHGRTIDWAAGIRSTWEFGEAGAARALDEFVEEGLDKFDDRSKQVISPTQNRIIPFPHLLNSGMRACTKAVNAQTLAGVDRHCANFVGIRIEPFRSCH